MDEKHVLIMSLGATVVLAGISAACFGLADGMYTQAHDMSQTSLMEANEIMKNVPQVKLWGVVSALSAGVTAIPVLRALRTI